MFIPGNRVDSEKLVGKQKKKKKKEERKELQELRASSFCSPVLDVSNQLVDSEFFGILSIFQVKVIKLLFSSVPTFPTHFRTSLKEWKTKLQV